MQKLLSPFSGSQSLCGRSGEPLLCIQEGAQQLGGIPFAVNREHHVPQLQASVLFVSPLLCVTSPKTSCRQTSETPC